MHITTENWRDRAAVTLSNGVAEATLLPGGGHLARWGLAADQGTSQENLLWEVPWKTADPGTEEHAAIAKVFVAKGRPSDNPLIVHVAGLSDLRSCGVLDDRAERLAHTFMPGPLTLVVASTPLVPLIARAGLDTVALRIPAHPVAAALITKSGPLVAPSANLSGHPSPTRAEHVYDDLAGRIAAVIDGGPCRVGIESTVVDLSGERAVILRPGIISVGEIEDVLGEPLLIASRTADLPKAPGMKYRHYAPFAHVHLAIAPEPPADLHPDAGRIILTPMRHIGKFAGHEVHPLQESTLYALFREADVRMIQEIFIYAMPDELDAGLLDRIRKAAE